MTNKELQKSVLKAVGDNHIWINAFDTIRPTPELERQIGRQVLQMLADKRNLLPKYLDGSQEEIGDLQKLTPVLYLSVNAS